MDPFNTHTHTHTPTHTLTLAHTHAHTHAHMSVGRDKKIRKEPVRGGKWKGGFEINMCTRGERDKELG